MKNSLFASCLRLFLPVRSPEAVPGSLCPCRRRWIVIAIATVLGCWGGSSFGQGFAVPNIVVEQPAGTAIANKGAKAFGAVASGTTSDLVFTLRNAGTVDLTGLGMTIDGADADMFSVLVPPTAPVVPGGSTTFTIRFAPTNGGGHTAALHIASNDFVNNPFDLNLSDTTALSANTRLTSLTLNNGTLVPVFATGTTAYAVNVPYTVTSVMLTPTKAQTGASIKVNGTTVASGSASSAIALAAGTTTVNTVVTAEDGTSTRTYAITFTRASAAVGDVDVAYDPRPANPIYALATQPDGKLLVGGTSYYFQPNGGTQYGQRYLARLNADGTVDTAFNPVSGDYIYSITLQPNGKILAGGNFTNIAGTTRTRLARLNSDGTLDSTFGDPLINGPVYSTVLQPDGKILVAGSFSAVAGVTRNYLARLNADGSLDTIFNPAPNGNAYSILLQADGKILVGGYFGSIGGGSRTSVARLNADGTLDTTFTANTSGNAVLAMAQQADGSFLLGGNFFSISGTTRNYIARVSATGVLDTTFNPNANGQVSTLVLQADGKVLLGGSFTTLQPNGAVSSTTRNYVARINSDGTLDATFNPNAGSSVNAIAIQADGGVLVGGNFTSMGITSHSYLARLGSDAVSQALTVPNPASIQWLRSGALPEASETYFEVSVNGGTSYSPVGYGTRISGGWQCVPAPGSLPTAGQIRAQARGVGGQYNGSSGTTSAVATYTGFAVPVITVQQPAGTALANNGSRAFGSVASGSSGDLVFTVSNTGALNLTGLGMTFDGPDAEMFSISASPTAPVAPAGSTTFTVHFAPTNGGGHAAALHIASNDFANTPFNINLTDTNALSANTRLSSLALSAGTLTPAFATLTGSYTASVLYGTASITLTPVKVQAGATIKVNGTTVASGSASGAIALNVGANVINTVVTAADGSSTRTYTVTVTRAAPAPGDVDLTFDPGASGAVYGMATQPDGKLLLGLSSPYLQPNGGTQTYVGYAGRMNANGTLDTAFAAFPNSNVYGVSVLASGKILMNGSFSFIGGATRQCVARLNADGTADTTFADPQVNSTVLAAAVQSDGKVLIGGYFSTVAGVTRNYLARLNADGSLDTSFNAAPNSYLYSLLVQSDGKILVGGGFSLIGGGSRQGLARLNADGSLDTTFNTSLNGSVYAMAYQPDGKLLIGGYFSNVGGSTRNYVARLSATGAVDSTFNPSANGPVYTLALQADGKILLGGSFTTLQPNGAATPTTRNYVARVNADGTLDTGFNPNAGAVVYGIALQADGEVLVGGNFTSMGSASRNYLVRLGSDAATQALTVPSASRLQWLRGGALGEASEVTFQVSTDGGSTYSLVGAGARIAGGWEYIVPANSLPASGQIRALARSGGGYYNGSSGLSAATATYSGFAVPALVVEQPAGTAMANNASRAFGSVAAGSTADLLFTVRNTGTVDLTGLGITIDGPDSDMFSVLSAPVAPVTAGSSTSFTVRFAPTNGGGHTAALHLTSNDFIHTPFNITLTDTAAASANARLSSLVVSAGTLTPAFATGTTSYTDSVAYGVTSVTLSPVKVQAGATIKVNGTTVASGAASGAIALAVGANVINTVVTAVDGVTTRTYALTITRAAAVAGDVDLAFDPRAGSSISALAVQPDAKILVGGSYYLQPNGGTLYGQQYLARLNAAGTVDTTFSTAATGGVYSVSVQNNGKNVAGGDFSSIGGATRSRVARLNTDGTADATFADPQVNSTVLGTAPQPDGKVLICGYFSTVAGATRNYLARVNADGTLDTSFNPAPNSIVYTLLLQPDGKILVGGSFNGIAGVFRQGLARLNADGTLDATFNASLNGSVYAMAYQPDGQLLIGGSFASVNGSARNCIARVSATGVPDTTFNPNANNAIYTLAQQADGKILLGGVFTTLQPNGAATATTRNYVARINADGTLDTGFNPNAGGNVLSLALQADGQVLLGGNFTTMGATTRSYFARLQNDTATQLLSVANANQVQWLRGGALPEASSVAFEVSIDGGTNYTVVGSGSRIAGGWSYTPPPGSLPSNGLLRAKAVSSGGYFGNSSGITAAVTAFPSLAPEIAVEQPVGTDLTSGTASVNFGSVELSASVTRTFTIKNSGFGPLGLGSVTVSGGDASTFVVSTFGMLSVVPAVSGSTTFTVTCSPLALGTRTTTLSIVNDDSTENPFVITLNATCVASTNASLAGLATSAGTLAPVFDPATNAYTLTVPNATSSLTVTPSAAESHATIKVNTVAVASGTASGGIALTVGSSNTVTTVVTAQDGTTTKTYTITVNRLPTSPSLVTTTPAVGSISATIGGTITSDGGSPVTERGMVYALTSDNASPHIGSVGVTTLVNGGTAVGSYSTPISGLKVSSGYSFAAYAINAYGTSYSAIATFTTASGAPVGLSNFMDATTVVGQADFTSNISTASQVGTSPFNASAISATGKLAVADGTGRVLIWNTIPTANGVPADVVVGRPDFTSTATGVTASLLGSASYGVAFSPDGGKLLVSDTNNNRVLIWNTVPATNGAPASVVIGQSSFTTRTAGTSSAAMGSPSGLLVTPAGKLFIADSGSNRVLVYNSIPSANNAAADLVTGQPDFTSLLAGTAASAMSSPQGLALSPAGSLLVADTGNRRVLVFNTVPTSNGTAANLVIGQAGFGTGTSGTTAATLNAPYGVAVSTSGKLAIADAGNHRVLVYNNLPASNGAAADIVLGQPNFVSGTLSNGGVSAHSMAGPGGVTFAADGRLLVAGSTMDRLMIFGIPGALPAPVLTSISPAFGSTLGGTSVTLTGTGFTAATSVTIGGAAATSVVVVNDTTITAIASAGTVGSASVTVTGPGGTSTANGLFIFAVLPVFTNNMDATSVVGQASFTANVATPSQVGTSPLTVSAISATGKLAVADNSGRVLLWNTIPTSNGVPADVVVGRPDFASTTTGTTASLLGASTAGVAFSPDGGKLLISDYANNRVLIWNTVPAANGVPADVVIGQTGFITNTSGTSSTTFSATAGLLVTPAGKLFIADYLNNRVMVYNSIPTTNGAAADGVIGQADFISKLAGSAANQMSGPQSVAQTPDGRLLVVDSLNHRVLMFNTVPAGNGASADVVIGQTGFGVATSGTTASALSAPRGVAVSSVGCLAIADTGNNRVLVYNSLPASNGAVADMVLGQPNFVSGTSFNGGISAHSMASPAGVTFAADGRLLVSGSAMDRMMIYGSAAVLPPPTIAASSANLPANAVSVTIAGTNFNSAAPGNNTVVFSDGAAGTVTAATLTQLTVTFSTTPVTAGPLTAIVTTPSGSNGSAVQVATVIPVVTSSTVGIASTGTTLTISGCGFDPTAGNNTVVLSDGAVGTVTAATSTTLTVTLGTLPAGSGPITAIVTTNGQASGSAVQVGTVVSAFQNGSFETNGGDNTGVAAGWTFGGTANGVKIRNNEGASDGGWAAIFNGAVQAVGGVLSQTFATVAGQVYTVQFDFGAYGYVRNSFQKLQVEVRDGTSATSGAETINSGSGQTNAASGGVLVGNTSTIVAGDSSAQFNGNVEFSTMTFTFTAQSVASTLVFTDVTTGDYSSEDGVLDHVQVTALPPTVTLTTTSIPFIATSLTITGTRFDPVAANNLVAFTPGGSGIVTAATATSLSVTSVTGIVAGNLYAVVTSGGRSSGTPVQVATVAASTGFATSNEVVFTASAGTGTGSDAAPNTGGAGTSAGSFDSVRSGMALSGTGAIAFRGHLNTTGGVTCLNYQGIWKSPDSTNAHTYLLAQTGSAAPDAGTSQFDMLPLNPFVNNLGQTTFVGYLRMNTGDVTSSNDSGIWTEQGTGANGLRLLLRKGEAVTGGTVTQVPADGWVAVSGAATASGPAYAAFIVQLDGTRTALMRTMISTAAGVTTVAPTTLAKEGDPAPAVGGTTWFTFGPFTGNSADPRMDSAGGVAFLGSMQSPAGNDTGIWYQSAGGSMIAQMRTDDPAVGLGNEKPVAFERPSLSRPTPTTSSIAFRAFMPVTGQTIWQGDPANPLNLAIVARQAQTTLPGTPAGSKLWSLWSPFSNGNGRIAFRVSLLDAGGSETRAIVTDTSGTLRIIAKAGDAAPGLGADTFVNFDHPVIGDGNQVAFSASTAGGVAGIWKQAANGGALSPVLKIGDPIVSNGTTKTIAAFVVPGTTTADRLTEVTSMDATGRMLVYVTYTTGETGILLTVP